ncbi:LTA synthase family protein [Planococcus sp. CAU13]|uniref:LTA synthase family protein n=1 Tax=Planococcus sp. CAU13 TaxID=1541197 RepID=UPI0006899BF6|nr:alkaline phosphatase family protein [Planococcus sp. CAU13]
MKFKWSYKPVLVMLASMVYFYFLINGIEAYLNEGYEERALWRVDHKEAFFFNFMIVFSLFILLLGIFNRFFVSFIVTNALVLVLAVFSFYKFSFLGEFLYPWDLMLYNNILNLLPNLSESINMTQVVLVFASMIIVVSAISAFLIIKKPKRWIRLHPWVRILFVGLGTAYLSIFIFYRSIPEAEATLKEAGVTNMTFDQSRNYKTNGFLLTFLLNMQSAIVLPPRGYSENNIMEIVDELAEPEQQSTDTENQVQPNIIVIMSESFWDPTSIEGMQFNKDPMPNIRELQIGQILSPTFGGGTSNVEFEVLTGFTNMFLPPGSVPYQQYIKKEIPAMPGYLNSLGYQTTAIHPYPKWFWNREEVYQHLGFEKFIDIDGFVEPVYKGPFVSDQQVTETIIEEIEASDEPSFVYVVTMQNHTGYDEDKYPEFTVEVEIPEGMAPVFGPMTRAYAQGVADADEAFRNLLDHYEASDEPTVVVFFGDHLPALGHDYAFFKQSGYVPDGAGETNWELEDQLKMKTTPLVIWNNFDADVPDLGTISTSFLAPAIYDVAGIEKPLYHQVLESFQKQMPGYTNAIKMDAEGNLFKITPDEIEAVKRPYELIQYDLLFGDQYSREKLFGEKK